jgi:hypothetical protein
MLETMTLAMFSVLGAFVPASYLIAVVRTRRKSKALPAPKVPTQRELESAFSDKRRAKRQARDEWDEEYKRLAHKGRQVLGKAYYFETSSYSRGYVEQVIYPDAYYEGCECRECKPKARGQAEPWYQREMKRQAEERARDREELYG